jgi:hypothetical protein
MGQHRRHSPFTCIPSSLVAKERLIMHPCSAPIGRPFAVREDIRPKPDLIVEHYSSCGLGAALLPDGPSTGTMA